MKKEIRIATDEELRKANIIVGVSYGLLKNNQPGESNETLARITRNLYERYQLPLALQWEIAKCLPDLLKAKVVYKHRTEGEYLDTFEVLDQIMEFCIKTFKKPTVVAIIVAHPVHLPRVILVAEKLGFIPLVPPIANVPYDKQSIQRHTRNRFLGTAYEKLATIKYSHDGKI